MLPLAVVILVLAVVGLAAMVAIIRELDRQRRDVAEWNAELAVMKEAIEHARVQLEQSMERLDHHIRALLQNHEDVHHALGVGSYDVSR